MSGCHTLHLLQEPESMDETHSSSNPPVATSSSSQAAYITGPILNRSTKSESSTAIRVHTNSATYSCLSGESLVDLELNAMMAESWSVPTLAESIARSSREELMNPLQEHNGYHVEALESYPQSLSLNAYLNEDSQSVSANEPETSDVHTGAAQPIFTKPLIDQAKVYKPMVSSDSGRHTAKTVYPHSLQQFLDADASAASWSSCNLRLPGSMCLLCGETFTTPHNKDSVIQHIRYRHPRTQHNLVVLKDNTWKIAVSDDSATRTIISRPIGPLSRQKIDLSEVGRHFCDKLQESRRVHSRTDSVVPTPRILTIHGGNPRVPNDRILSILNCLDPNMNPKRPNHLFNTLDLVASNLLDRFPGDTIAQSMERALSRLNCLYALNFGKTQHSDYHPILNATPRDLKTCTEGDSQRCSSPLDLSAPLPLGSLNGNSCQQNGLPNASRKPRSKDPVNGQENSKRLKKSKSSRRLLACPIKKDCEVYDRAPTCTFRGAANLSSITLHLKGRGHQQQLPFLALCRHCWEHTVSEVEYRNVHNTNECRRATQPRYEGVPKYWHQLYAILFPHSARIPSPYTDEIAWRPKHQVTGHSDNGTALSTSSDQQLLNFNNMSTTQSFLEQDLPAAEHLPPPEMSQNDQLQRTAIDDADAAVFEAICQLLSEHVHQRFDLSDHFTAQLAGSGNQTSREYLHQFSDRMYARVQSLVNSGPTLPSHSRTLDSQVHELDTPSRGMSPPESLWLGQLPISSDQHERGELNHVVPPQSYLDFFASWEQQDDILALASASPSNNDRVMVPPSFDDFDMYQEFGVASCDGSHSAISA